MIFGFAVEASIIIAGGVILLLLIGFQMAVGLRVIHFKGRTHQKVHRRGAWALAAVAVVHGSLAIIYVLGLNLLS